MPKKWPLVKDLRVGENGKVMMMETKEKDVVIGLIMLDGKLLIRQRKDINPLWDKKWEFSGGKVEINESYEQALIRELKEETGLEITNPEFLGVRHVDWSLPNHVLRVHLQCFLCHVSHDQVIVEDRCCYGYVWVDPAEALTMDLLEGNAEIIRKFLLK